jgi:hypothetical protein
MEQNPIRPRKGSWIWLLIGSVVLTLLSAVAPPLQLVLFPSCIVSIPPVYPYIFPPMTLMLIVGGWFIVIALLTICPTRGGYWGARIALVGIATIMTVCACTISQGIMSFWFDSLIPKTTFLLFLLYLWVLPLLLHHRISDSIRKEMIYLLRYTVIFVTAFMVLDHGPIFALFVWLYWTSYCRIQRIDRTRHVPVSDSIRYFSWMSAGVCGTALLMGVIWGWEILLRYPSHIDDQKEYFLTHVWSLVLLVPLLGVGVSLSAMRFARYQRMQGVCLGFLFTAIPVGMILVLQVLWTVLSLYARIPYNFTMWTMDPTRFLEGYGYNTLWLSDLLIACVVLPWFGALVGSSLKSVFKPTESCNQTGSNAEPRILGE